MRTILSGVKSTSAHMHLGNYFGAVKQFVDLQNHPPEKDANRATNLYFIANYHALTTMRDGAELAANTWGVLREYLAYGLAPQKSIIFFQSDIPELTELTWLLNCIAPMGLLERAHAYKDAVAKGKEANVGLFDYPVLMAADILMYGSTHVPVGKDQKQHVEIARDLADKFNHLYGETFVLPNEFIMQDMAIVPGIDGEKMSKSYGNTISPFEEEKSIVKKIMSLKTDSKGVEEPKTLEGNIIWSYLQLVGKPETQALIKERFLKGGMGYGEAKKLLAQEMLDYFDPMRKKYESITMEELKQVAQDGAKQARAIAQKTIAAVRTKVGLV